MSDDSKNRRNYEDLKARLGLKKTTPDPEVPEDLPFAPDEPDARVGEPLGDRTPAGGFDLGLERGATTMDSSLIDVERAAAQMAATGGPDIRVRASGGMRALVFLLLAVGIAAAFGLGWSIKGTQDDRMIEERQLADAAEIKAAMTSAKVLNGDETLVQVVEDHRALIMEVGKRVQDAKGAQEVTDALLKTVEADLMRLHKACIAYAGKGPFIDSESIIGKRLFNGEAVKIVLDYERALQALYRVSVNMATEDAVLNEFRGTFDPAAVRVPQTMRTWRWAVMQSTEQVDGKEVSRPKGFLSGASFKTGENGELLYRKQPLELPPNAQIPEGQEPPFRWEVSLVYENESHFKVKEGWAPTDVVVSWDLSRAITDQVREQMKVHHGAYRQFLLRRLFNRVTELETAARDLPDIRQKSIEKLAALAGE